MNTTVLLLLIIPVIWSAVLVVKFYPRFTMMFGSTMKAKLALPVLALPGAVLILLVAHAAVGIQVADHEVWNGQVTGKKRSHGHYLRSYECMCSTDSKGNRTCSTCYEDRYTVTWDVFTNVGPIQVDALDRGTRAVYLAPDPRLFVEATAGQPAAVVKPYTNYVQAVPHTLFRSVKTADIQRFANMVPKYPLDIYGLYRLDRFLPVGVTVPDQREWNAGISELLKVLGPTKQVNIIVVAVNTDDQNYVYALQHFWEGANKNDVVLVIGTDGKLIKWADVISWTRNELFKIQLRDEVLNVATLDRQKILQVLDTQVREGFVRRQMAEFEYLKSDIAPPTWLMIVLVLVLNAAYAGMYWRLSNTKPPIWAHRARWK